MSDLVFTFPAEDEFEANNKAEQFLRDAGFSVGRMERQEPRGILFGEYDIQKWRNLRSPEREILHGQMTTPTGSPRTGPIEIRIFERAPQEAKRAFHKAATRQALATPGAQP